MRPRGLESLLDRRPLPFACVTPAVLDVSDEENDFLLAQWCLGLDDGDGGPVQGGEDEVRDGMRGPHRDRGMHLLPGLFQQRMLAVQRERDSQGAVEVVDGAKSRRGPRCARMEKRLTFGGAMKMCTRGLQLESHSDFVTARSRSGVVNGCWAYEVVVQSGGHIQVGWATSHCSFSDIAGVGDTLMSVAFDGQRALRWNRKEFATYGRPWVPGDVVGCTLNLDSGEAIFYLNGEALGVAYSNLRRGQGLVYYPAVSLAHAEQCTLNFGALPFEYEYAHASAAPAPVAPHHATVRAQATPAARQARNSQCLPLEVAPAAADRSRAIFLGECLGRVCCATANPALRELPHNLNLLGLCDKLLSRPSDMDALDACSHLHGSIGGGAGQGAREGARHRGQVWAEGYGPSPWAVLASSAICDPLFALVQEHRRYLTCEALVGMLEDLCRGRHYPTNPTPPPASIFMQDDDDAVPAGVRGAGGRAHDPGAGAQEDGRESTPKNGERGLQGGAAAAVYALGLVGMFVGDEYADVWWIDLFELCARRCARCPVLAVTCA